MKCRICLSWLCCLTLVGFALAEEPETIRILSYNVKHGGEMDKRLDILRTADVVKRANPTYVGLQEVDQMTRRVAGTNTCQVISERCGMRASFGKAMPYKGGEYGNALLSREAPLSVKTYPLAVPSNLKQRLREPRVLVMCEFRDFWVGSTHLNGDPSSAPLVRRAVEECAALKPVFVMGDWNALPDSDLLKEMRKFLTILSREDKRTMHHKEGYCIDYIAVDAAHAKDFEVVDTDVVQDPVASDHRPIYVDLKSCRRASRPDSRVRTLVGPVRAWGTVVADSLTTPKYGQVAEGEFLVGSGPVLKRGDWLLFDFGCELHGGAQIGSGAKSGRNAFARVRFGESVSEAMSELGERGACNAHAIRDDVVRIPWYGRREIGETGFRFVRIDNTGEDPLHLEFVRAVSVMRPMKRLGGFCSSDARLNRIFETAVRTVHLCCQDYLWDGIKRDRLVWMGDTHPETMTVLGVFGAVDVLPSSLDYMAATTPADKWMNGMPTYTLWWIRNLAEWYRFTGDKAYLLRHAAYLERTFEHVAKGMNANGLWTSGNFLDWPTKHNGEAATAGTQGLALITARETAFLAHELGRTELEKKAETVARKLSVLRPDPHGAKSAAALLALSGLRTPREMFDVVLGKGGHAGVSTFYGYYMLEAMSAANENQRALETVRDYWGGMLDVGATSFWEDFNLAWTNNCFRIDEVPVLGRKDVHGDYGEFCYKGFRHSLCHGWSAGPAAWCISHVLGIRPAGVGCKKIEVSPDLCDLKWAEGSMALPNGGRVTVRAERRPDDSIDVSVTAPAGIEIMEKCSNKGE